MDLPALRDLLVRTVLDTCFPPRCVACVQPAWDAGKTPLCAACLRRMPPPVLRCPACGRREGPHGSRVACPACAGPAAGADPLCWSGRPEMRARRRLRGVVAAWGYGGPPRELVVGLKFRARPEAAAILAAGLVEALQRARVPGDLVVPVPLSARRRRARGYDQARLLARPVARALGLELRVRALWRTRHTAPQSGLPPAARRRGPRGAFGARRTAVAGRCVLLVDDVLTTGATAWACARALRAAGALAVTAAVACRTERRNPS